MKNYAIIGFGGLGKSHFLNLVEIEKQRGDIRLVAICNAELESITKSVALNIGYVDMESVDFSKYNLYTDYKEMIEKENLDFVFVTLPSFLHNEAVVYCLGKGLDVYTEKPMALELEHCEDMINAACNNNKKLMVGQCLRFTSEYKFLKKAVESGIYGKPIKAEFSRKSPIPLWSASGWLLDEKKSGGCIVDMHIHDVDAMVWLFGVPEEVYALSTSNMAKYESTYALYKYPNLAVSIIGDWGIQASYKFKASYGVTFENAYIECINGKVTVYTNETAEEIELEESNSLYEEEVEFIEAVVDGKPFKNATIESVYETMKIIFEEKRKMMNSI